MLCRGTTLNLPVTRLLHKKLNTWSSITPSLDSANMTEPPYLEKLPRVAWHYEMGYLLNSVCV